MEDGHFIDDPLDVVNAKPDFIGLGIICRWLREVHGLHIYTFRLGEKWHYEIQVFKEGYTYSKVGGDSHDEAVEKAIWKCINELI